MQATLDAPASRSQPQLLAVHAALCNSARLIIAGHRIGVHGLLFRYYEDLWALGCISAFFHHFSRKPARVPPSWVIFMMNLHGLSSVVLMVERRARLIAILGLPGDDYAEIVSEIREWPYGSGL